MKKTLDEWQKWSSPGLGDRVYFDHNATTPPAPDLFASIEKSLLSWGNPSSIHWAGREAKQLMRESRSSIAKMIGASALEIIFTAGGSEANNLALKGVLSGLLEKGRRKVISTEIEHPSILKALESLRRQGAEIQFLRINRQGEVDWDHYLSLLDQEVGLVSVMLANNETGSILPVKKIAKEAHRVGALVHTDAVQALGKIPLNVGHLGVDMATFSGHKFYALKGVGVLYSRKGLSLERQIEGGGQERHRRAGTENLLAISSLAAMAPYAENVSEFGAHIEKLRDQMQNAILESIDGVVVNGGSRRVPNTLNVSIQGLDGESLLMNLDLHGFAVSTGAACSSGNQEPSPALKAMGLSFEEAQSSLRISLGWSNTEAQVNRFVEVLSQTVTRLRKLAENGQ